MSEQVNSSVESGRLLKSLNNIREAKRKIFFHGSLKESKSKGNTSSAKLTIDCDSDKSEIDKDSNKTNVDSNCEHPIYTPGSIVWAHLRGYPWWPALIDLEPDTHLYYRVDEHSNTPMYYHCTFFDTFRKERAWIKIQNIRPFSLLKKHLDKVKNRKIRKNINKRLQLGIQQAREAVILTELDRLKIYSFIARCKIPILYCHKSKFRSASNFIKSDESSGSECPKSDYSSDSEHSQSQQIAEETNTQEKIQLENELSGYSSDESFQIEIVLGTESDSTTATEMSEEIPIQPQIRVKRSDLKIYELEPVISDIVKPYSKMYTDIL